MAGRYDEVVRSIQLQNPVHRVDVIRRIPPVDSRIQITGWISSDSVRRHLLDARALVLPSFAEGLPVVIMEAMALRRPVISTYVAGIPELVQNGDHGWLVPAGDVDALATAMRECLDASTTQLQTMGEAARGRVIQRHHIDTEALKLTRLLVGHDALRAENVSAC